LPIWIQFMREALKGVPDRRRPAPEGLVQLRVSSQTGALVGPENPDGYMETFMADHLPSNEEGGSMAQSAEGQPASSEPIF
jgi:penicillin-binding protein 1A